MEICPVCKTEYDPTISNGCPICFASKDVEPEDSQLGEGSNGAPPAPPPEDSGPPGPPPLMASDVVAAKQQDPDSKYVKTLNCSSRVDRRQMDRFVAELIRKDLGFPVFSVCDCNSFHTSGYMWGLYAAKMMDAKGKSRGPVAIINFDQHDDYGGTSFHYTRSDGWGASLLNRLKKMRLPCFYLTVGNGEDGTSRIYIKGSESSANRQVRAFDKQSWTGTLQDLGGIVQYLFITIDRDCLNNSYTQWGDGCFRDTDALTAKMKEVLSPMIEACQEEKEDHLPEIIGFDITGLPEHRAIQGKTDQRPVQVWKDLDEQLVKIKAWISNFYTAEYNKIRRKPITLSSGRSHQVAMKKAVTIKWSKVVFFGGSVSYTWDKSVKYPAERAHPEHVAEIYIKTKWRYPDYIWWIGFNLKRLLTGKWNYLVCRQNAPVFMHGWKEFKLYRPEQSIVTSLSKMKSKFLSFPRDISPQQTIVMVLRALGDFEKLSGFACTASLKNESIPRRLGKAVNVIFDPKKGERGEFVEAK